MREVYGRVFLECQRRDRGNERTDEFLRNTNAENHGSRQSGAPVAFRCNVSGVVHGRVERYFGRGSVEFGWRNPWPEIERDTSNTFLWSVGGDIFYNLRISHPASRTELDAFTVAVQSDR